MAKSVTDRDQEESLREAAALGNEEKLESLIRNGVVVNAQNTVNGWTPLHWACKRGHRSIVEQLLRHGADVNLLTAKGETCLQMTDNPDIITLLGGNSVDVVVNQHSISLPIVPNYLSNPVFPYYENTEKITKQCQPVAPYSSPATSQLSTLSCGELLDHVVLKVRVANSDDPDFIEVDMPSTATFDQLVALVRSELELPDTTVVRKVRKLPDTIVRNDRDVRRLRNFQELELVLVASGSGSGSSAVNQSTAYTAAVTPKRIDVFY